MKQLVFFVALLVSCQSFAQSRNEVIITEIMANPTPPALQNGGLPEAEYIELKNISAQVYNLNGWTITDNSGSATIRVNYQLKPDSFLVICATSNQVRFAALGPALGIASFPSLDNEGEQISLRSRAGALIHAVYYHKDWYRNAIKSEGGWSLEMVDPQNTCSQDNWLPTVSPRGGTPGTTNSINGSNPDIKPPELTHAFAPDSLHVVLVFTESLDSLRASNPTAYKLIEGGINVSAAQPLAPMFDRVMLALQTPLGTDVLYRVATMNITDCAGNIISRGNFARVALPKPAAASDIVINEILFNPPPEGADFIELYNRSTHTVNLKDLFIAGKSTSGTISQPRQLIPEDQLMFPGDYIVITENVLFVKNRFNPKEPVAYLKLDAMPSFPDDRGVVILMSGQGLTVDQLSYDEDWHFKLITNLEGVSLERIDYDRPTQDPGNWHSAATDRAYGTPGNRNSQFRISSAASDAISIDPKVFSPDNDGRDDFASIRYQFDRPGFVCNVSIFDSNGRLVRTLLRNALCGLQGVFRWDGLDEKQSALGIGMYVISTTIFNLEGKTSSFKHPIVLARKLQ